MGLYVKSGGRDAVAGEQCPGPLAWARRGCRGSAGRPTAAAPMQEVVQLRSGPPGSCGWSGCGIHGLVVSTVRCGRAAAFAGGVDEDP
jgi:hypothetical protein